MSQQPLQGIGGALTGGSLIAANQNFDELYAYYGVAAGNPFATTRFVDGDNGSDTNNGLTPAKAKKTIQAAVDASGQGDRIIIKPLEGDSASGDTDPDSYTESITITAKDGLQLIGAGRGMTQGGQPQIKVGTTTTNPIITVNSFGVGIHNLTINGVTGTGGGVKLVCDGATATKDAGGFLATNCHFKNCKSTAAAGTGGAVYWSSNGGCWYVTIRNCEFLDCRAGVSLTGTAYSVPRGCKIIGCRFWSTANTQVDADIYAAGSGFNSLLISDCDFGTVDGPAYATSPDAARYIKLATGTSGLVCNCRFACVGDPAGTELTIGAAGTACILPTTIRFVACWGEGVAGTATAALIGRT